MDPKFFWTTIFFCDIISSNLNIFFGPHWFGPNLFFTQNYFGLMFFGDGFFSTKIFLDLTFFLTKKTSITTTTTTIIMGFDTIEINLVWTQNLFGPKYFGPRPLYFGDKMRLQILIQKPKCTWDWSLTLALAQLVYLIILILWKSEENFENTQLWTYGIHPTLHLKPKVWEKESS